MEEEKIDNLEEQTPPEQQVDIASWVKKFKISEKIMKDEFLWKYKLAKKRLRADYDVKSRNTAKMTHENVNLVQSIGTNFVNSVYFKSPQCNLTAREEQDHEKVENTETKVNDWLKDKKVKKGVRRNVWDGFLGGFGARFIDHEYEDMVDEQNVISPQVIDPITGQEIQPAEFGRIVLKNEIVYYRVRPDLVRFPRGFDFDNYQESPWIGFDMILPISQVRSNKAWDESVRNSIEGEKYSKLSKSEDKNEVEEDGGDELYAKISYVFEKPENDLSPFKLLVFCHKYTSAPLQYVDYDKGHIGYPIKFLYFNPLDDDCSYPNGDCWTIESQLAAVDTWWRRMVRHVEKSNPKRVYNSKQISQNEVQKLKSNNDLEWVGVENKNNLPLDTLIASLDAPLVNPDASNLLQVAQNFISEIAPKSGLSSGNQQQKKETATAAKIEQMGEVIDIEARIDDIKDFLVDIVLDVAGILEKSMIAPVTIMAKQVDELGNETEYPKQVDKTGFTSKITADVDVESMQAQNKDVMRRQLLDALGLFNNLKPFFDAVGRQPNPEWWIEQLMSTMNIRNIEDGFVDAQPMVVDPATGQPMPPMPEGAPAPEMSQADGGIPLDAIEAGQAQRI